MASDSSNVNYSVISLFKILGYATWVIGLIYTIVTIASLEYVNTGARIGQFFFGILLTLPAGGILIGVSEVLASIHAKRNS